MRDFTARNAPTSFRAESFSSVSLLCVLMMGAQKSRRRPAQVQVLLFLFRGFSSVKNLSNDPR